VRLKEVYEKYRADVEFIVVYVKEAHASDRWWLGRTRTQRLTHRWMGGLNRIDVKDPVTLAQRRKVAASCQANLFDGVVPLYVDTIANEVAVAYTARPTRIYLIGRDGRVIYNPGIGPFGFSPDHLEPVIEQYLSAKSEEDAV
jgi:thyroxine 5-deiodinase